MRYHDIILPEATPMRFGQNDPEMIEKTLDRICEHIARKTSLNIWITESGHADALPPNAIHDDLAMASFPPVKNVSPYRIALMHGWIRVATHNKGTQFSVQLVKGKASKAAKQSLQGMFEVFGQTMQQATFDICKNERDEPVPSQFTDGEQAWNFLLRI